MIVGQNNDDILRSRLKDLGVTTVPSLLVCFSIFCVLLKGCESVRLYVFQCIFNAMTDRRCLVLAQRSQRAPPVSHEHPREQGFTKTGPRRKLKDGYSMFGGIGVQRHLWKPAGPWMSWVGELMTLWTLQVLQSLIKALEWVRAFVRHSRFSGMQATAENDFRRWIHSKPLTGTIIIEAGIARDSLPVICSSSRVVYLPSSNKQWAVLLTH